MKTLSLRQEGAKKPASIPVDKPSALLVVESPAPDFEPPDPCSLPPDDFSALPEPIDGHIPPILRNAARRAFYAHRRRLQGCAYEAILLVALDRTCVEIGHARIAQAGLAPADISALTLIAKAHAMEAAGIILLQNRPGPVDNAIPIDPSLPVQMAYLGDLLGLPLVEYISINSHGEPFFVRERGILKDVPQLLFTLRECTNTLVKNELERGICSPNYEEPKTAAQASADVGSTVEVTSRRRR